MKMQNDQGLLVRDNPGKSRFEIESEGEVAIAEYTVQDGVITFTHTYVPEQLGGRGLATRLAEGGLAAAREKGLKVIPECSVFVRYMQKHPETQDLAHSSVEGF